MKKLLGLFIVACIWLAVSPVSAHVVVSPNEVVTASRTTFTLSVPNEHNTPVTTVRLVIPAGLDSVRPHAKPGWNIHIAKTGEGDDASFTEITWMGGSIPVDLKDDFLFSAQVPADVTELKWKAYETYASGMVVAWDQEPSETDNTKPYSVTKVVARAQPATSKTISENDETARTLAGLALVISLAVFAVVTSKTKKK